MTSMIVLVSGALFGCGSSNKASGPKLESSFAARVSAVCARQLAKVNAFGAFPYPQFRSLHPDPKLLPRVGAFLERLQPAAQAIPGQLRALGEPTMARANWDRVRSQIAQGKAITTQQIASAKRDDAAGFAAESKAANHLHDEIISELEGLGFAKSSPCSQVV